MIRFPDGDTDFFAVVAGVLQEDTLVPYLLMICLDYILRTSMDLIKEYGCTPKKPRSRRYPADIINDAHYADDLALSYCISLSKRLVALASTQSQRKFITCILKRDGFISILSSKPRKRVKQFIYL